MRKKRANELADDDYDYNTKKENNEGTKEPIINS